MFLLIFTLALIGANIYFFISKKYLYLFIPCLLFLPEYYGIEFSESLPILTCTRIMYLIFYVYAFVNRKGKLLPSYTDFKQIPKEFIVLLGYFLLRIIANLYYVGTYSKPIKTIFIVIFEQMLFAWAVYMIAPSKEELNKLIKIIVWVATAFFVIGIFESVTFIRPFDYLYTVSRHMLNIHFIRLGLLRATTTMGMPGLYGNMCILIMPLILYLIEITHQKRYLLAIILDVFATIHSGSRSDMLFLIAITLLYIVFIIKYSKTIRNHLLGLLFIVVASLLTICILSNINDRLRYYYTGTAKSILNEFGSDYDLVEGAPDDVEGYGENANNGSVSRLFQLTGIVYTFEHNPLFGLGSGVHNRGQLMYKWQGHWYYYDTIDVGLVEIIACEGLVGLLANICLLVYWGIIQIKLIKKSENNISSYLLLLLIPAYLLSTLSTANMYPFLFVFMCICYGLLRTE